MKKIIVTLIFLLPFMSGCTKVDSTLTINNNKSAQIEVKVLTDKTARPLEMATVRANIDKFVDKSYKIVDNSNPQKIDLIAKKTVDNLKNEDLDMSSLGFKSKLPSGKFIEVRRNIFVTSFNIHMIYKLSDAEKKIKYINDVKLIKDGGLTPEYFQKYADESLIPDVEHVGRADFIANFDENLISEEEIKNSNTKVIEVNDDYKLFDINNFESKFSILLPTFASYNNAQMHNGNIYTWVISKNSPTEIKLQYVVYNGFTISLLLLVGILLLIYLAKRIHRHDTLKRIGNNN